MKLNLPDVFVEEGQYWLYSDGNLIEHGEESDMTLTGGNDETVNRTITVRYQSNDYYIEHSWNVTFMESYWRDGDDPFENDSEPVYYDREDVHLILGDIGDRDHDGMADEWEREHFGDESYREYQDYDDDGYTNYEEFMYGTDPKDDGDPGEPDEEDAGDDPGAYMYTIGLLSAVVLLAAALAVLVQKTGNIGRNDRGGEMP